VPWGLRPAEAQIIDSIIAFGSNKDAAEHLKMPFKTFEGTLARIYKKLEAQGIALDGDKRTTVMRLWLSHWWGLST
jgi:FixJ family two-component response regulator